MGWNKQIVCLVGENTPESQNNHTFHNKIENRQENTSINAQENESRYSDIFALILVALFQKQPKAGFSKIKTTRRVALFLSTFSRLAAGGSLKKLASIKAIVFFPD